MSTANAVGANENEKVKITVSAVTLLKRVFILCLPLISADFLMDLFCIFLKYTSDS